VLIPHVQKHYQRLRRRERKTPEPVLEP